MVAKELSDLVPLAFAYVNGARHQAYVSEGRRICRSDEDIVRVHLRTDGKTWCAEVVSDKGGTYCLSDPWPEATDAVRNLRCLLLGEVWRG